MKRRTLLLGAAGLSAAAAGIGWQAWRQRHHAGADVEASSDDGGLWSMRFPRPEGGELVMAALRGRPLLLNFWATWCPPCVKEMPGLDRFQRQFASRGWQVVGLAVDSPTPVREFLQRTPIAFPIGLAGFEGAELSLHLGNPQGALPFTAVFDAAGRITRRKVGETEEAELARWAEAG